jgi:hypothetical protein
MRHFTLANLEGAEMPQQTTSDFLAWVPLGLAGLSAGFYAIKKVVNHGNRLALVERSIAEDRDVRYHFMATYEADRKADALDRERLARLEAQNDLILQEVRRR